MNALAPRKPTIKPNDLLHPELYYSLRGAAQAVHAAVPGGVPLGALRAALSYELRERNIDFVAGQSHQVLFHGQQVGQFAPDYTVAEGKAILDISTAEPLGTLERQIMVSRMRAAGADFGLVLGFGGPDLREERVQHLSPEPAGPAPVEVVGNPVLPADLQPLLRVLQEVYAHLGPGFSHGIYRRAVQMQLKLANLPAKVIQRLPLNYRGKVVVPVECHLLHLDLAGGTLLAVIAAPLPPVGEAVRRPELRRLAAYVQLAEAGQGVLANFHDMRLKVWETQ